MTVSVLAAAMTVSALAVSGECQFACVSNDCQCASFCHTAGGPSAGKPIKDAFPAHVTLQAHVHWDHSS